MNSVGVCLVLISLLFLRSGMHNTILQRLKQDPLQSLARFASGRDEGISIVGCFRSNVNYPVWLAKTSSAASGMERLRKERDALAYLQPWSEQFRIPSVLDWHVSDGEICLILSGLPGFPDNFNTTGVG